MRYLIASIALFLVATAAICALHSHSAQAPIVSSSNNVVATTATATSSLLNLASSTPVESTTTPPKVTETVKGSLRERAQNNFSPDGKLNFRLVLNEQGCSFRLESASGTEVFVRGMEDFAISVCIVSEENSGIYLSNRIWLDNDRLFITKNGRDATLIDIKNQKVTTFTPGVEMENYIFRTSDNGPTNWVYQENYGGKFAILDSQMKPKLYVGGIYPLYDEANNAFIFLGRKDTDGQSSLVVTYVSLDTYSSRTILETTPVKVPGMGCNSWGETSSVKGEVRLNPGNCYARSVRDYIDVKDGLIHIPL